MKVVLFAGIIASLFIFGCAYTSKKILDAEIDHCMLVSYQAGVRALLEVADIKEEWFMQEKAGFRHVDAVATRTLRNCFWMVTWKYYSKPKPSLAMRSFIQSPSIRADHDALLRSVIPRMKR